MVYLGWVSDLVKLVFDHVSWLFRVLSCEFCSLRVVICVGLVFGLL